MNAAPSHQMKIRIVSASRRTDIPAFYGKWFMNRVRAGWCAVPNPFNSNQVSRIEFDPGDTLLVFWTRWAAPFLRATDELSRLGYRFYFQYTLINYPKDIDQIANLRQGCRRVSCALRADRSAADYLALCESAHGI
jgi:hypothetical protein